MQVIIQFRKKKPKMVKIGEKKDVDFLISSSPIVQTLISENGFLLPSHGLVQYRFRYPLTTSASRNGLVCCR